MKFLVSLCLTSVFISLSSLANTKCDPSPMRLPQSLKNNFGYSLGQAQRLDNRTKGIEGMRLLLKADQSNPLARAYTDYYVAQMYANEPSQSARRVELLQSALDTRVLQGAELQDTLQSLADLLVSLGQRQQAEGFKARWSKVACDLHVKESASPQAAKTEIAVPAPLASLSEAANRAPNKKDQKSRQGRSSPEQLLEYVEPDYPEWAFEQNVQGFVSMTMTITREGFVTDVSVLNAEPKTVFDQAAIRAVRQWRFQPQFINGKAVDKTDHRIRLEFAISQPEQQE